MKYHLFYFDITAENEEYFEDRGRELNEYAKCPGLSEVTSFLCMSIDEEEAIILKLIYPTIKLYPYED